jgi:hypothetical protein
MAFPFPRIPTSQRRMGTHLVALAGVLSVAVIGTARATPAFLAEATPTVETSATSRDRPAQVQLPLGPVAPGVGTGTGSGPVAPRGTQGADQTLDLALAPPPGFNPSLGLPAWLRATHGVSLWSGADSAAALVGTLPAAGAYLKPLGAFDTNRVQVYFPGDDTRAAMQAWVDNVDVEPSGVPAWIAPPVATASVGPRRVGDVPAPYTTAVHIAIVDGETGKLLYGEDPDTQVPQASTTKIATTIVALEREPNLARQIQCTVSAIAMVRADGSSTMGIEPGETVTLDTLLHGMMLPSGNDAAEQVAISLGGSRERYVDWMNQEAAALGLRNTHFENPSGMDATGHYSSAYDMAMLARYAMRNAQFRDLASAVRYTGDGYPMHNLNRFLELYPGADGVKIGFTDAAQKTIVASATRDGHRVYVSLMRSQDLPGDSRALFDWVWNNFDW